MQLRRLSPGAMKRAYELCDEFAGRDARVAIRHVRERLAGVDKIPHRVMVSA
jgi:hypothetical protein